MIFLDIIFPCMDLCLCHKSPLPVNHQTHKNFWKTKGKEKKMIINGNVLYFRNNRKFYRQDILRKLLLIFYFKNYKDYTCRQD
jgi:hypothetical protein